MEWVNSGIKQYIFSHIRFYRFYTIVYGNVDWLVLRRQIESLEDKCKNFSCIIFYFGMIESKILSLTSLCNHQGSASKSLFKALNSNWHYKDSRRVRARCCCLQNIGWPTSVQKQSLQLNQGYIQSWDLLSQW